MKTLIEQFGILYPKYAARGVAGTLTVEECEAADKGHYVRRLHIDRFNGWMIPHEISKENTDFYKACQEGHPEDIASHRLVRKDCDGLLTYETPRAHVVMAVEIKTSFRDVIDATRQIIGSILKLESMMSLLQGYDSKKIKYKGIIISHGVAPGQLSGYKNIRDTRTRLSLQLARQKPCTIKKAELERLFPPLSLRDIEIVYIPVASASKEAFVSFPDLKSRWQI